MKITYIDVDDVLIPTTSLIISELQKQGRDKGVTYDSLKKYDVVEHPLIGEDCMTYCTDPAFLDDIEIEESVVRALAEIMELSDITYLHTGTNILARRGRTSWYLKLVERLVNYTEKRLVLCYSGWPKMYPPLEFFCIIEDYAEVLIPPVAKNKFLIEQPWNSDFHDNPAIGTVVNSFCDIPKILRSRK